MRILFVCSANKDRSKTAEIFFSERYPEHEFKSAGTNHKICEKIGSNPLQEEHLQWAEQIYVMEEKHRSIIQEHTGSRYLQKLVVLNIPDVFKFGSEALKGTLEKAMRSYL